MFTLELRVGEFDLFEPFVLFAQQPVLFFGYFQADRELGVFIRKGCGIFVPCEHQRSVPHRADNSIKIGENSRKSCSAHMRESDHSMRRRPHIVAIE
jgi:hypothetical protein